MKEDLWRRQWLMVQPFIHKRVIRCFYETVIECNRELTDRWMEHARLGELVDLIEDVSAVTLDIILQAIFRKTRIH